MKQKPKYSVVIPTFNEEKYLPLLLEDLHNQTFKDFEVIVSDANSTDSTRSIAKKYGATVCDGGLPSVGRNNGAKLAKGDVLVFLDADVRINRDFIECIDKEFSNKNLDVAVGLFDTNFEKLSEKIVYSIWNLSKIIRQKTKFPDGDGQFMVFKKSIFEYLEGFNENVSVAEDSEILKRVKSNNFKFGVISVRYVPSNRRYKKIGHARVIIGSTLAGIIGYTILKNNKKIQKFLRNIYRLGY